MKEVLTELMNLLKIENGWHLGA